ncbi:hypothetical protein AB0H49_02340 [Nocardia sp. NPDC050713]|uniref:RICIN domain-containing protein n=1 Tax=unclassified Nocardia TaxID=2637762 RepID=UPI0033ACC9E2
MAEIFSGIYLIFNCADPGSVMAVTSDDGASVGMVDFADGGPRQQWRFDGLGDGVYVVFNQGSNMPLVLDKPSEGGQAECGFSDLLWTIDGDSERSPIVYDGMALTPTNGQGGWKLTLLPQNGADIQQWRFLSVG